ncbi:hypothetical protein BTE77_31360 [Ensifer adhaerens]|nr:hypothetical protein BTE77_31360 [Ensifer adhaerens]
MAVFTLGGRLLVASLLKSQTFFLAVGEGNPSWDTIPVEPAAADTGLVALKGFTRMREIAFVMPNEAGTISMADGARFAVSAEPTRYLYLQFKLDLADANGTTLRESGICHGTQLREGFPPGQMYIPEADTLAHGQMIHADRYNSIIRDGTLEQSFSFVLTL